MNLNVPNKRRKLLKKSFVSTRMLMLHRLRILISSQAWLLALRRSAEHQLGIRVTIDHGYLTLSRITLLQMNVLIVIAKISTLFALLVNKLTRYLQKSNRKRQPWNGTFASVISAISSLSLATKKHHSKGALASISWCLSSSFDLSCEESCVKPQDFLVRVLH